MRRFVTNTASALFINVNKSVDVFLAIHCIIFVNADVFPAPNPQEQAVYEALWQSFSLHFRLPTSHLAKKIQDCSLCILSRILQCVQCSVRFTTLQLMETLININFTFWKHKYACIKLIFKTRNALNFVFFSFVNLV